MPVTGIEYPILGRFFCAIETTTGMPPQPLDAERKQEHDEDTIAQKLPQGVVLGPDGKPCRSCTSSAAWMSMMKKSTAPPRNATATSPTAGAAVGVESPANCPPDVEALGRSSWSLLHSITATYPTRPTLQQQSDATSFLSSFSRLYPCWVCASDFQDWMAQNKPRVSSREDFGRWMCEAHNAVNVKLGKESFNCDRWEERWRTGWKDGTCG